MQSPPALLQHEVKSSLFFQTQNFFGLSQLMKEAHSRARLLHKPLQPFGNPHSSLCQGFNTRKPHECPSTPSLPYILLTSSWFFGKERRRRAVARPSWSPGIGICAARGPPWIGIFEYPTSGCLPPNHFVGGFEDLGHGVQGMWGGSKGLNCHARSLLYHVMGSDRPG